jgi:hypothetical protein
MHPWQNSLEIFGDTSKIDLSRRVRIRWLIGRTNLCGEAGLESAPLIVLLLILSVLGLFHVPLDNQARKPAADLKLQSIAVLPFKTDPSQAYLGQGIAKRWSPR